MKLAHKLGLTVLGAYLLQAALGWEYNKNEDHPDGAKSVDKLKKDGDYYLVKGADLHNLGGDLIGKKIRVSGYAAEIKRFPSKTLLLKSEDQCYFVIMFWGSLGNIPDDLQKRLEGNGVRAAGGIINRYEGDKLTIYCTVDSLMKEGGLTGSALRYKSCIVKSVEKWEKGWPESKTQ